MSELGRINSVASRHYGVMDDLSATVRTVETKVAEGNELIRRGAAHDAVRFLEAAVALGKGPLGVRHPIILEAEGQLGLAYLYASEPALAIQHGAHAHSDSVEALGLQHDLTVRLASMYFMSLMATAPFEKSFDFYFRHLRWLQDQDLNSLSEDQRAVRAQLEAIMRPSG